MHLRHLLSMAVASSLFWSTGCITEFDAEWDEAADDIGQSSAPIVNGTTTTDYEPVVRISWSKSYSCGFLNLSTCTSTHYCTATAIANDLLVTASHCVKDGNSEASYVKVAKAHGSNSGAEGKKSSYFIMSEDIYNNIHSEDEISQYWYRDFAFVKFGAGTFSNFYDTTYSSSPNGLTVTKVGFGGDSTKEYATKTVSSSSGYTSGNYRLAFTPRNGAYGENGDSGGPLLRWNSSTSDWEVLGVVFGTGTVNGVLRDAHPVFTPNMETYILAKLRTELPKRCAENFEHSNYGGFAWSFCNTTSLDNSLDSFTDPFIARSHWDSGQWNDEMSSIQLPTGNIRVTYYEHGSQGGSSVTFHNLFDWGDGSFVPSLSNEGMNDKVSSYYMVSGGSGTTTNWHLGIMRHRKCIDTSGNWSAGTDVYQWDCGGSNDNQIFRVESVGSNYRLKHKESGLCLGAEGGGTSNGTDIELQTCDNSNKQLYTMSSNASTSSVRDFKMVNVKSGKCVDLSGGSSSNGTVMHLWSCSNSNQNQNFELRKFP